jgi:hypothetical protein
MKTITNLTGTSSTDVPNIADNYFPASATFKRTVLPMADGLHAFYQLGDGKTTGHLFISFSDIMGLFENGDTNFKIPEPLKPLTIKP